MNGNKPKAFMNEGDFSVYSTFCIGKNGKNYCVPPQS